MKPKPNSKLGVDEILDKLGSYMDFTPDKELREAKKSLLDVNLGCLPEKSEISKEMVINLPSISQRAAGRNDAITEMESNLRKAYRE